MDLVHHLRVPASIEQTWTALTRLERIAPCFPGATLDSVSGSVFSGSLKVKIGPTLLTYQGSGTFLQRSDRSHRVVIEARGTDSRGNGTAAVTFTVALHESGPVTDVEVKTEVALTGRPGQLGRGVLEEVADKTFDQFVSCLTPRFAEGIGAETYDGEVDGLPPSSDAVVPEQDRDFATAGVRYTPPSATARPHTAVVRSLVPLVFGKYGLAAAAGAALLWLTLRRSRGGRRNAAGAG